MIQFSLLLVTFNSVRFCKYLALDDYFYELFYLSDNMFFITTFYSDQKIHTDNC